jgi:hypothetical protein
MNSLGIRFSGISHLRRGYLIGATSPSKSHMVILQKPGKGICAHVRNEYALKKNSVIVVPFGHVCMFG